MMRATVSLSSKEYASYLRRNIRLFPHFWGGSMSGFVIGRYFSIANRAEYEWNRRITCECSRAFGVIVPKENGAEIRYIQVYGLFSPFWLISSFLLFTAVFWSGIHVLGYSLLIGAIFSLMLCGSSALMHSFTPEGIQTSDDLEYFLLNPDAFM